MQRKDGGKVCGLLVVLILIVIIFTVMVPTILEVIFGIVGSISLIISLFALLLYVLDSRTIEPIIIQTIQRVLDNGNFQILVEVTNVGKRSAINCAAKIYIADNPIENLSFQPIDSPIGRIGADWPKLTSFEIHPNTPIMLRSYLSREYVNREVHVRLLINERECQRSNTFTLTIPHVD